MSTDLYDLCGDPLPGSPEHAIGWQSRPLERLLEAIGGCLSGKERFLYPVPLGPTLWAAGIDQDHLTFLRSGRICGHPQHFGERAVPLNLAEHGKVGLVVHLLHVREDGRARHLCPRPKSIAREWEK